MHAAAWPSVSASEASEAGPGAGLEAGLGAGDPAVLAVAADVLGQVRKAKTAAKLSMRAEAARVVVLAPDPDAVTASRADLIAAGNITDLSVEHAAEFSTEVTLAEPVAS